MSKVTTTYDNTLKEKIFIIKGEEGYARSTDCILTELYTNDGERRTDWNTSLDAMKLEFRIDVLRDVGASQVVLYDNDTTIGVYDFDTNTHSIDLKYEGADEDNRIKLSYDVEHHIYAKYMGNKQCMKSQSQSYEVKEDLPHSFECDLAFLHTDGVQDFITRYDTNDDVEFKVKLLADSEYEDKTLKVYEGKTLIGEYVTDENGLTETITLSGLDNGLHTLSVEFDGSEYLAQKSKSVDISIGYVVSLLEYPSFVVNKEPAEIVAKVMDYFGDPPLAHMSLNYYAVFEGEEEYSGSKISTGEQPTSDGMLHFSNVGLSEKPFWVGFAFPYAYDYVSPITTTNAHDDITLTLSTNADVISTNYTSVIFGTLSEPIEGVEVRFNSSKAVTGNDGIALYPIEGSSSGDISVTGSIYGASDIITIEDVVQYWSKSDARLLNREWDIRAGTINSATNGWKCTPASNNYYVMNLSLCEFSHTLELIVKGASGVDYVRYCGMWVAQTSLKAGDVIRFDYDYDDEIVSFYKNDVLTSTTSIPKDTQVSWGFRTTSSTGYVVFDKLILKRIK